MTRLRTLIIEDDRDVAKVTRGFVERHGDFTVVGEVGTGRTALEAIVATKPDLLLLDVYLPDMSGIAVLRTARAHGYVGEVVAVTAASEVETVRRARQLGVRHYLVKPYSMRTLHERLNAVRDHITHERTLSEAELDQEAIDALLADESKAAPVQTEGSAITLDRVQAALANAADGASANEIAAVTGLSRVSARRYLQRLVGSGLAVVEPRYGAAGRPELQYRTVGVPGH